MANRPLALRIAGMQIEFVRRLNDIHIFIETISPSIEQTKSQFVKSTNEKDREYDVPKRKKRGMAKRTDKEVAAILERFTKTGLFQTFLGTAVSEFEAFLGKVLKEILKEYPRKLTASVKGNQPTKQVPLEILLDSDSISDAVGWTVDKAVSDLFYSAPKVYLQYLKDVGGIMHDESEFGEYLEIKATRDVIVHNLGTINDIYLDKAGDKARGVVGETAIVDKDYFENALALLKRLSGIIKRNAEKAFRIRVQPKK